MTALRPLTALRRGIIELGGELTQQPGVRLRVRGVIKRFGRRRISEEEFSMAVLRQAIGETLRGIRLRQRRTLREVSTAARVSLGYLSEIERGQKEPSSELLASICDALDVTMSEVFREVTDSLRRSEVQGDRAHAAMFAPARPSIQRPGSKPGPQGPQVRGGHVVSV